MGKVLLRVQSPTVGVALNFPLPNSGGIQILFIAASYGNPCYFYFY
jgi:hypothetical protein